MAQPINLRNGYVQPDFDPNKKDKSIVLSLVIAVVLYVILRTCIL